jgi:hypothetical protein
MNAVQFKTTGNVRGAIAPPPTHLMTGDFSAMHPRHKPSCLETRVRGLLLPGRKHEICRNTSTVIRLVLQVGSIQAWGFEKVQDGYITIRYSCFL